MPERPETYDLKPVERISDLRRGDIVRHRGTGNAYVIDTVAGEWAVGVNTLIVQNPIGDLVGVRGGEEGASKVSLSGQTRGVLSER